MVRKGGFTLLELMVVMAVLGVLLTTAVPSFKESMDRNAVTAAANNLLSSILLARSEAVKRETTVTVAKDSTWRQWNVFIDTNSNHAHDAGETLLGEFSLNSGDLTVKGTGKLVSSLSFNSRGRTTESLDSGDKLIFTQGGQSRYVCFSAIGRPRILDPAAQEECP